MPCRTGHHLRSIASFAEWQLSGYREPTTIFTPLLANTWYTLTVLVDDLRGNTIQVDNSANPSVHYVYNVGFTSGKSWRFHAWVWSGSVYLDDYMEFNGGAVVVPDERMNFTYDDLDRLIKALGTTTGGYTETYAYNPIGNLTNKAGVTQWYSDTQHDHAITHLNGSQKFWYDANGNMITRTEGSTVFVQQWNIENKLTAVISNGVQTTQFIYDGDGNRVKKIDPNGQPTIYIGAIYEKNLSTTITTTYYFAGSTRIAERQGGVLYYLVGDHLGSTSLTLDQNGNRIGEIKYRPYGETRYISGSIPTDRRFTGQRSEENNLGSLYDYGARFYSPAVGRFLSADSYVKVISNPQNLNRYAYVLNDPLRYTDPTGLFSQDEIETFFHVKTWDEVLALFRKGGTLEGHTGWLGILMKGEVGDAVTIHWDKSLLPSDHTLVNDQFSGLFQRGPHGELWIAGKDMFIDQMKAALYGERYGLSHYHPANVGKVGGGIFLMAAVDFTVGATAAYVMINSGGLGAKAAEWLEVSVALPITIFSLGLIEDGLEHPTEHLSLPANLVPTSGSYTNPLIHSQ